MKLKTAELTNSKGTRIKILNYGGKIMSIKTCDRNGELGEIVLGYDHPEEYLQGNPYFGATIGRCANRISGGKFLIDSKVYHLNQNQNNDHLHGGPGGFHQVFWEINSVKKEKNKQSLTLNYTSADMEEAYPGELKVSLIYTLTQQNELIIDYMAESSKSTIVNLSHHSFFNLKDGGKSSIESHYLKLYADHFTPVNERQIPTGEIIPTKNTPFNFNEFYKIGDRIDENHRQLKFGKGYDHNYVLNKSGDELSLAAQIYEKESGRVMEVYTTEPGIQLYTGNFLDGSDQGKEGLAYQKRSAFCLEAQHFPDAPNHDNFPSIVLNPGEKYTQKTIYKFKVMTGF